MTTWVETSSGGRERGVRGLARAWVEVLVRPRRFFRTGIAPGDQVPGLAFGVAVALAYLATLLGSGAAAIPGDAPVVGGRGTLGVAFVALAVAVVVAPAALHLVAALQTLLLMATVPERATVSETVQVVAYATAPCAVAGLPSAPLRAACALYGSALLVVGLRDVHDTTLPRAAVAGALPAMIVFGHAFGGLRAVRALARAVAVG